MSRSQQDQFIDDDEEETCPLCVEDLDLSDKGFRPCPCGYQICQFCYNNVKNNMNGLCPACRRVYNDKDIQWKQITPEEQAAHKTRVAQKLKKSQAAQQKEKQKAEAEQLSRKHLSGLRVVQKNLVYVTGLSPTSQEDQLLQTLRGDQYFGQYGKIVKIVVSKAKDPSHPHSVGVYVTYERKDDAASCIAAVNNSKNGDRTLRAQFGTTKYCSAYLRGEQCTNRQCMFLHEPGEAGESYSRADLSALNAGSSQHGEGRAPPPQSQQPVASAAQPMARQGSDQPQSPAADRPALPSTASWASKPLQTAPSRNESRSTSGAMESPAVTHATPAPTPAPAPAQPEPAPQPTEPVAPPTTAQAVPKQPRPRKPRPVSPLVNLIKNFTVDDFKFVFSLPSLSQTDLDIIKNYPPLFDQNGGAKRRVRRQREEEQRRMEQEAQAFQQPPIQPAEQEDNPEMSGSLQLGGEPEERQGSMTSAAIRPPGQEAAGLDPRFQFGAGVASPAGLGSERGMTPHQQQQQQMLLSNLNQPTSSFGQQGAPGHQRNVSRFSFANDTATASASVKPVANQKLMNQQSSIMPQQGGFAGQQASGNQPFYTSNVQGPPPGLKTTGTPPVSGGMTFGQGHGFATGGLQYGPGTASGRNGNLNEEMMRNLLRGGVGDGGAGKPGDISGFPPLAPSRQASIHLDDSQSRTSTPPVPPGFEGRSTPTVPPGLSANLAGLGKLSALPHLDDDGPVSRPASRPSLSRQASRTQILPALPLKPGTRPGTPRLASSRPGTPSKGFSEVKALQDSKDVVVEETPTKKPKAILPLTAHVAEKKVEVAEKAVDALPEQTQVKEQAQAPALPLTPVKVEVPPKADQEKPAVADSSKSIEITKPRKASVSSSMQPASKSQATVQATDTKAAPVTPTKAETKRDDAQKRKHPGKLDITAAVNKRDEAVEAAKAVPGEIGTPNKTQAQRLVSETPSAVSKPESPSVSSPLAKSAPRTLRVVQTPKADTPPLPSFPTPALPTPSALGKLPSRQPSLASINPPGTPSSEQVSISDNISMTSTSVSRANSPPPSSIVGSAPVRTKTKAQQKKERQERAKAIEEEKAKLEETVKPAAEGPEVQQEAILSRKKKSKKEKEPKPRPVKTRAVSGTTETTPTASRPASPGQRAVPAEKAAPATPPKPATPIKAPVSAPQPPIPSPHEPSPPPTPTLTAASLLAELKAQAPEIQKCIDSLFRTPNSAHFKPGQNISPKDLQSTANWKSDFKINLTKDEVDALLKGTIPAVNYGGQDGRSWDRGMVTPTGAHLRALTEELEARFLDLEKALREMPDELRFRPSKPQNEMKFPNIDLEALKRSFDNLSARGPSVMEQMVQDGSTMKKGAFLVDEASKYINEFVMPPATPPPSAGGGTGRAGQQQQQQQAKAGAAAAAGAATGGGGGMMENQPPSAVVQASLEIAERQLQEAKRIAEENEGRLKKIIKKNKRLLGLG